jgi:hypothetical protein
MHSEFGCLCRILPAAEAVWRIQRTALVRGTGTQLRQEPRSPDWRAGPFFPSTYFNLLRLYHDLVDTMQFDTEATSCRGKACFRALADEWRADGLQRVIRGDHIDPLRGVKEEYAAFYEKYRHLVGHYFRTLYNIIRVIEVRGADDTGMYFRLLRAQLSRYELELLFYNNLSDVGEGLGRRAAEHGLLSHVALDKEAAALFADELVAMKDDETSQASHITSGSSPQ